MTAPRDKLPDPIRIGIINISDRASAGIYEDLPGKEARRVLDSYLLGRWDCIYAVIPDDQPTIEATLCRMADEDGCSLILTTGGTGPAPRDVTPEATMAVCDKLLPGFGEAMRMENFHRVPTSILSRQTAGYRGTCLIVNLPGKPKAIEECLQVVFPAIPYAIELIGGGKLQVNPDVVRAFRPKTD